MKKFIPIAAIIFTTVFLFSGCNSTEGEGTDNFVKVVEVAPQEPDYLKANITNPNYIKYKNEYDIIYNTDSLGGVSAKYYSKYLDYIAPNSKSIHILAQDKVTPEQMLYVYSMLSFYLNGKDAIANSIANSGAVINMPNGADGDGNTPDDALSGQPLYQFETANVGSVWYINNDYAHRDATFEEVFHFVHDYGIGTVQHPQADSATANAFENAMKNALPSDESKWGKEGLWGLGSADWLKELSQEGSLAQEYIASVIDSYYGLWEAYPGDRGMWGLYIAKTRVQIQVRDPMGYAAVTSFLPPFITSMMHVDPSFNGDFKIYLDTSNLYTYKSQYLKNVCLTGSNNSNLYGNDQDNILAGNSGNNIIDGKGGNNIVQFYGKKSEYTITKQNNVVTVTDSVQNRDGVDTLHNISTLRFIDQDVSGN